MKIILLQTKLVGPSLHPKVQSGAPQMSYYCIYQLPLCYALLSLLNIGFILENEIKQFQIKKSISELKFTLSFFFFFQISNVDSFIWEDGKSFCTDCNYFLWPL